MKKNKIKINEIFDLVTLVQKASEVEGDVILSKDRYEVDAKSLMGVMSIDVSKPVFVTYPDAAAVFEEYLKPFIVE